MTTVTVDTEIAAPIERVFEVFTDLEHSAETVGGFRLGTRWLETREASALLAARAGASHV